MMDEATAAMSPVRAWGTVLILFFLSTTAWMDRSVISMVIGPLKAHFGIGDFQVSLLVGLGFIVFYIGLLAPIGWLADRYSRRKILFVGVTIWSLATVACGLAGSYVQLMAARMAIGAGEGSVSPIAAATISRTFGRKRMAAPIALYSLGTSAGTAIGVMVAGYILAAGAATGHFDVPLLGRLAPWQLVFVVIGLPGLVLALLAFAIPDLRGQRPAIGAARDTAGSIAFIRANPRAFLLTVGGFVTINVAVTSVFTWTPEHLRRSFGEGPATIGWIIAATSLGAPLFCQLFIGFVVNRMARRGVVDAPLRVMRWLLVAALPLGIAIAFAPSALVYNGLIFVTMALIFTSNPLGMTAIQQIAPDNLRSGLAALHLAALGVVGVGLGSSLVAFLSQYIVGEDHLGLALGIAVSGALLLALLLLQAALAPYQSLVRASTQPSPSIAVAMTGTTVEPQAFAA